MSIYHRLGLKEGPAVCLANIAGNALKENRYFDASRFWGAADRLRHKYHDGHLITREELCSKLKQSYPDFDELEFYRVWDEGRTAPIEQMVKLALQKEHDDDG